MPIGETDYAEKYQGMALAVPYRRMREGFSP